MSVTDQKQTPATIQGELWSVRAWDWAELQEPQHLPKDEDAVRRTRIGAQRPIVIAILFGCGTWRSSGRSTRGQGRGSRWPSCAVRLRKLG